MRNPRNPYSSAEIDRASHEHQTLLQAWLERRTEAVRREARAHIRATLFDLRAQLPEV